MQIIEEKWNSLRESEDESLSDVEMIGQFKNLYDKLTSSDAVDQVYFGHLFPFLASLWGGQGLNKDEALQAFKQDNSIELQQELKPEVHYNKYIILNY